MRVPYKCVPSLYSKRVSRYAIVDGLHHFDVLDDPPEPEIPEITIDIILPQIQLLTGVPDADKVEILRNLNEFIFRSTNPEDLAELRFNDVHCQLISQFQYGESIDALIGAVQCIYTWICRSREHSEWFSLELIQPLILVSSKIPKRNSPVALPASVKRTMIFILRFLFGRNSHVFDDLAFSPAYVISRDAALFLASSDIDLKRAILQFIGSIFECDHIVLSLDDCTIFRDIFAELTNPSHILCFHDLLALSSSFISRGDAFCDVFCSVALIASLFASIPETNWGTSSAVFCRAVFCRGGTLRRLWRGIVTFERGIGTRSDTKYKPFKNGRYKFFSDDMNPLTLFLSLLQPSSIF
jgi:hypothetical protein